MNQLQLSAPQGGGQGGSPDGDGWGARGFIRFGMACVLILGGGFGTWAATAELAGAVIAMGQLRSEANRQVVQHPDGGVVSEILARDGDVVEAGQVLVRLDPVALNSEHNALESQFYEILARLGRLDAMQAERNELFFDEELIDAARDDVEIQRLIQGQAALFAAQRESMSKETQILDQRKIQLGEQIGGVEAEIRATGIQLEKIGLELASVRTLFKKGLVQADRLYALEREEARLDGTVGQLTQQVAQLRSQISETEIEQIRMFDTMREETITESRELGFRRLEIAQRLVALRQRLSRLEIKAPRPGVVIDSTVFALDSVIRPAEPIMFIIPSDTGLIVDARMEPTDIDSVSVLQETVLRFSALNTRTTPELFGKVSKVSADSLVDEQSGLSYYKVEVKLNDGEIQKLGDQELVAGMPVEAYIQTGGRTPFEYLMKPISDYFSDALKHD